MVQGKGPLSVTQLNDYLKMMLDGDRVLSNIFVRGEISNFKIYPSGHLYFTLKDTEGQLKAVMFRSYVGKLLFRPADGMRVIAHGRVSVYGSSGQYQLYADELQPDGAGSLALRFEQLKQKLAAEGLFDEARKRPLPPMPMKIGVITSPVGAAIHDMINVLGRRFPIAQMILYPSQVQGEDAPLQLIGGLEFFSATQMVDVIIIGRGGGSAEDLWAFNDEMLARAVANCSIPVISAVGHESDCTICDFVADRRAPTPSAAAELAVPEMGELLGSLKEYEQRMRLLTAQKLTYAKHTLQSIADARVFRLPLQMLDAFRMKLSNAEAELEKAMELTLSQKKNELAKSAARLDALNPISVLSRGYATVSRNKKTILHAASLQSGDEIHIRFADGIVTATVNKGKE